MSSVWELKSTANIASILPTEQELWPKSVAEGSSSKDHHDHLSGSAITTYTQSKQWEWSRQTIYFFCDIHADVDAFFLSLIASGGVSVVEPSEGEFELTPEGRKALFIIGGDCFDKGPSTLRLLDLIYQLKSKGADLIILAGNHDVRTYIGILLAENKDPLSDHLFVRMGQKAVPLFREIYDNFVDPMDVSPSLNESEIRQLLLPDEAWYENFAISASSVLSPARLEKEIQRIKNKSGELEQRVRELDLDYRQIYAALAKFKELFLEPGGRYHWFFDTMRLGFRAGSYLFVHAGLDDVVARTISDEGIEGVNSGFRRLLAEDPFTLYHTPIGNAFRTKYRETDYSFSRQASRLLHDEGIYAVVHGHCSTNDGQQIVIREGMLNIECNATIDRNTRYVEGIAGPGAAVVIFSPDGTVKGISTDYPFIKVFSPVG